MVPMPDKIVQAVHSTDPAAIGGPKVAAVGGQPMAPLSCRTGIERVALQALECSKTLMQILPVLLLFLRRLVL